MTGWFRRIPMRTTSADAIRLAVSLALALSLWGYVTAIQDPEESRSFEVSVRADGLAESLLLRSSAPVATITYTGPRSVIRDLNQSDVGAALDLSRIQEPTNQRVRVLVDPVDGVRRRGAVPAEVPVVIEREVTRTFPLTVGQPDLRDATRRVGDVIPEVSQVNVTGPEPLIDRITSVVLPIDIQDRTEDYSGVFIPVARDSDENPIAEVAIDPPRIDANVPIEARGKSVAVISQVVGEPAVGYEVVARTVSPPTVLIDGPAAVLDGLITIATVPVDITGTQNSVFQRTGLEPLPDGVQVLQPSGGVVDVVVQISQRNRVQPIPSQQVRAVNTAPGLDVTIDPATVSVVVVASDDQLVALEASDLTVQVDLANLGPGTYQLKPSVAIPPNVQWLSTDPELVNVTVTRSAAADPPGSPQSAATPTADRAATPDQ